MALLARGLKTARADFATSSRLVASSKWWTRLNIRIRS